MSFVRQGMPQPAQTGEVRDELDAAYLFQRTAQCRTLPFARLSASLRCRGENPGVAGCRQNSRGTKSATSTTFDRFNNGWTLEQRKHYFAWFNQSSQQTKLTFRTRIDRNHRPRTCCANGSPMPDDPTRTGAAFRVILPTSARKRDRHVGSTPSERSQLGTWLTTNAPPETRAPAPQHRQFVRNWTVDDLLLLMENTPATGGSAVGGKEIFLSAGCAQCHRFGGAGGDVGPDATRSLPFQQPAEFIRIHPRTLESHSRPISQHHLHSPRTATNSSVG